MRIVIKFAGALLEDVATIQSLSQHVAGLARHGHEILVIHGGGRLFTATLKRLGIESKFVAGLRVTDRETRDVAVMVFGGLLNKRLSASITAAGQPAIGISAADAACFSAAPLVHNDVEGRLGFVGYLTGVKTSFLESLWRENLLPVAACLGQGPTASSTISMPITWPRLAPSSSARTTLSISPMSPAFWTAKMSFPQFPARRSSVSSRRAWFPAAWCSNWKPPSARWKAA